MNLELVHQIEMVAARAWPALEQQPLRGWILRYSDGVTRRANSVFPLTWDGDEELDRSLGSVETYYHDRGLPPRFQMSPVALPVVLDDVLAKRAYRLSARTAVQTASLRSVVKQLPQSSKWRIKKEAAPGAVWLEVYAGAEGASEASLRTRQAIMAAIPDRGCYVVAYDDAAPAPRGHPLSAAAVGSGVVADGYLGIFNVATVIGQRRRGAAQAVLRGLAEWGAAHHADKMYLQVMADNAPALALYARLGFVTRYYYHYRETQLTNARHPRTGNAGR